MTFDMEKLIKHPLIDNQTFYIDDITGLAAEYFADICSDDPLGNALTAPGESIFRQSRRIRSTNGRK